MTLAPSEKKIKHITMEMEILTQPKTLMLNCHQLFKAFHQHEYSFDIFDRNKY